MMILKCIYIYIYIFFFLERRLKIWSKWERHGHEQHGVLYLLWMPLQSRGGRFDMGLISYTSQYNLYDGSISTIE